MNDDAKIEARTLELVAKGQPMDKALRQALAEHQRQGRKAQVKDTSADVLQDTRSGKQGSDTFPASDVPVSVVLRWADGREQALSVQKRGRPGATESDKDRSFSTGSAGGHAQGAVLAPGGTKLQVNCTLTYARAGVKDAK